MRTRLIFIIIIGLAAWAPFSIHAKGEPVIISTDEQVRGDVVRMGSSVRILAPVDGDVLVAGGTVEIAGPVSGDVIAAGGEVRIVSDVGGSVRVAGGTVEIKGSVGRGVSAAGGRVLLSDSSGVGGSVIVFGADVVLNGRVDRDVRAYGGSVTVAGEVAGNVVIYSGEADRITLEPTALVHGTLEYTAQDSATIREGAVVKGDTQFHQIPRRSAQAAFASHALSSLIQLFGLIVVGLVMITMVPQAIEVITEWKNVWSLKSGGQGLVWLILPPVVAVVLLFTLIGVPLALISMALWAVGLYVAQVVIAYTLGRVLLVDLLKTEASHRFFCLATGAVVWVALVSLPLMGWMIMIMGTILGLGSMMSFLIKKRQQ
ncbi:MAG: hypothetical protein AB1352_01280 [Patescibacteria group bacterium]